MASFGLELLSGIVTLAAGLVFKRTVNVAVFPGSFSRVTMLRGATMNPRTSRKQCTIAQQLTDKRTQSVVFAWLIGDDGQWNLVSVWQTPTGVLVNRGVVIDVGADKPIAIPYTSCISGHCEAIANLAPDFVDALMKATRATATVFTVAGEGLTFGLSVNGLAKAIDAVKAPTAG